MDIFFLFLAILNEITWRTQSEEFWVNFKVWGLLLILFIFTAFQIGLINKYKIDEKTNLKLIINNKYDADKKIF